VDGANVPAGHQLSNLTLGYQWFFNGQFRHQLNLVTTLPDAAGDATFAVLSELQFGF
jgi:hypothetical protein